MYESYGYEAHGVGAIDPDRYFEDCTYDEYEDVNKDKCVDCGDWFHANKSDYINGRAYCEVCYIKLII